VSATELSEELEAAIADHDLSEEHAIRVRELADQGVDVLDAIKRAGEELSEGKNTAPPSDDPAAGLEEPTPAMLKRLAKEIERHDASVRRIMGGFVEGYAPCSTCDGIGLEQPGPKPATHPFYGACPTCRGFGEVLTGSLEGQYRGVACPDCGSRGYLELMLDNTPAVEIVEQWRQQRVLTATQPAPVVLEPQTEGLEPKLVMGRPAWMGDPAIGA
jgi:hypothetical protein